MKNIWTLLHDNDWSGQFVRISTPSSAEAQTVFDSLWLAWYPRPKYTSFDNEGILHQFTEIMGLKRKPTTDYIPEGNSIMKEYIKS